MEGITPDDVRKLASIPPFHVDYSDIIVAHFGDDPPDYAWDFLSDILQLAETYNKLEKEKKNEEKNSAIELSTAIREQSEIVQDIIEKLMMKVEGEFVKTLPRYDGAKRRKIENSDKMKATICSIQSILQQLKLEVKTMLDDAFILALGNDVKK